MSAATSPESRETTRQRELGVRLRRLRGQQGLSLAQVEARSDGRWKAVVVGAYERGDRAVTIGRLAGLAEFYGVPLAHLLPDGDERPADRPARATDGLLLDVLRLLRFTDDDGPVGAVARFAARIRYERGDIAGHLLTLREDDARTLALAAGVDPIDLQRELEVLGLLLAPR